MTDNLPRKIRAHFDPAFDEPQEPSDKSNIAVRQSGRDAVFFNPDNGNAYIKSDATVDTEAMR